ncbi:MAG: glycosyltransferase, partial [Clostridia bacterium]|nr:glycosyltransferase [Clostridia bacterium]
VLNCVKSIKEKTNTEYRIYIVDNCSADNSVDIFKTEYNGDESVIILTSEQNNGFSAGNNIGIKRAISDGCDILCVTNSDILLINDAISILENKIKSDSSIGVAAPSIHSPNSEEESQFARNKLTYANFISEKSFLKHSKSFCKKHPRYQKVDCEFETDYKFFGMTYGCFYVAAAKFFVDTDYLDEAVFLFNEEDIMAYKLEKLSLYTLISPEAVVLHNHHSSVGKTSVANRVYHFRVSELIVLRKYAGVSLFKLLPIIFVFKLSWLIKSISSKDYRALKSRYFKALNNIKKIKRWQG